MRTLDGNGRHGGGKRRVARIAVDRGEEPRDWQDIFDKLNAGSPGVAVVGLHAAVGVSTLTGLFATLAVLALAIWEFFPGISPHFLACLVAPPAFLVGAASGQAGGNLFFRLWFGLDGETRRGFATRLTLSRAPTRWPASLRRWLFTGDWMTSPSHDLRLPYAKIFVLGASPATCREEDALWREIHGQISGDSLWEAGANHREVSYPRRLPDWAAGIDRGCGADELRTRIGRATADDWITHLWRRACRQWPALGDGDFPAGARRECFEIHSIAVSGDRHALVVVLRPAGFAEELVEADSAGKNGLAA